jgi:hypothetical protein
LSFHGLLDLERENFLDGDGLKGVSDAFLAEEVV